MIRALLIAISGIAYFMVSLLIFLPFRMKPIKNYNLLAFPLLSAAFLYLLYNACTVEDIGTAYLFAYFAGILMWQVLGEIPFIRVPAGVVLQFSDLNIKTLGGYFYVLAGWVLLYVLWVTGSIKNQAAFTFVIFCGIWTFEIYMDNYSARVPLKSMSRIANVIMGTALVASIFILYHAHHAPNLEQNTVLGGLLYLTLSTLIMAAGQWKKPQNFYLKYEAAVIEHEVRKKKEELKYINHLKEQMHLQNGSGRSSKNSGVQ